MARRLGDLAPAHIGELIDLLAEFGAVGVNRDEFVDEAADALVELGGLRAVERYQAGRLLERNGGDRRRRRQLDRCVGHGLRCHRCPIPLSHPMRR